jgi:hypothetical protein
VIRSTGLARLFAKEDYFGPSSLTGCPICDGAIVRL